MRSYPLVLAAALLLGAVHLASADNDMSPATPNDKVDNTGINTRDRNSGMATPTDQSSSQADTDVTANIRKAIIADDTLSVDAKNVKIITANGQVTLRGPVKSRIERKKIFSIAKQNAANNKVVNDLEIVTP